MKLEEYIRDHKSQFEEELPEHLWGEIQPKIAKPKFVWSRYFKYAAMLLVFIGIGYSLGKYQNVNLAPMENTTLASYEAKVNQKKENLAQLVHQTPELQKEFDADLADLQDEFDLLKKELKTNPNQDLIIQAMIQNLEWQIDLLNQQTQIAEKQTVRLL